MSSGALRETWPTTVSEFLDWDAPGPHRWQLVDGEPVAMAPANNNHATIQSELGIALGLHLRGAVRRCRVLMNPGVIPKVLPSGNFRVPDVLVTCSPVNGKAKSVDDPVVVAEILSPSNRAETWSNVWTYTSIPSVQEILILRSDAVGGYILRRGADGGWPDRAELPDELTLTSLDFVCPLVALYAGTDLL